MSDIKLKTKLDELREVDYSALDYNAIQTEILDYVRTSSTNQGIVDDFASGDAARFLIDLHSYLGEILAFRMDTNANENYLSTAQRKQSVINILELVAQRPKNPTYSALTLNVIPSQISSSQITIPARYQISGIGLDGNATVLEIMNSPNDYFNNVIIPAGVSNYNVTAYSGTYNSYDFVSTGESSLIVVLPKYPIIEESLSVSVTQVSTSFLTADIINSSRVYEEKTLVSSTTGIFYTLRYDEDGRAIITFPTASYGKIPPLGYTIHFDYRIGGGKNTNVSVGAIETSATFFNSGGQSVQLLMSNPDTFADGGEDADDLETIRLKSPGLVRANDNMVTIDDYSAIISTIPGVQDVFVVDAYTDMNTYNSKFSVPDNFTFIWILPTSGGELSPDLRVRIAIELEKRRLTAIDNLVINPIYNDWVLDATVQVVSTKDPLVVRQSIIDALLLDFGRDTAVFNNNVRTSKVIAKIQGVTGVDYVELTSPSVDLVADENTVLRLLENNITLTIIQ
jgi:hypothetical protein